MGETPTPDTGPAARMLAAWIRTADDAQERRRRFLEVVNAGDNPHRIAEVLRRASAEAALSGTAREPLPAKVYRVLTTPTPMLSDDEQEQDTRGLLTIQVIEQMHHHGVTLGHPEPGEVLAPAVDPDRTA